MDLGRSCSRQKIRFLNGGQVDEELATWYFAAPTAKLFPEPHAFGALIWFTDPPAKTGAGFVEGAPRTYYNGRRINSSDGTSFAGPLEFFVEGAPAPAVIPRTVNGTPVQCIRDPGLLLGGLAVDSPPCLGGLLTGGTCGDVQVPLVCGSLPATIYGTVLTGTGFLAPFVGSTFPTTFAFPNFWNGGVNVGGNVISIGGQCAFGVWFANVLYNGLTPLGSGSTNLMPVDFIGT